MSNGMKNALWYVFDYLEEFGWKMDGLCHKFIDWSFRWKSHMWVYYTNGKRVGE